MSKFDLGPPTHHGGEFARAVLGRMKAFLVKRLFPRSLLFSWLPDLVSRREKAIWDVRAGNVRVRITVTYMKIDVAEQMADRIFHSPFLLLKSGPITLDLPAQEIPIPIEFEAKLKAGVLQLHFPGQSAVLSRLNELKNEAKTEDLAFSERSEHDFFKFLLLFPQILDPFLFLLDNGNLRALWKNGDGEQVGLQFRGSEIVQYVIFVRSTESEPLIQAAGREAITNIERVIKAHDAAKLIFGGATHQFSGMFE